MAENQTTGIPAMECVPPKGHDGWRMCLGAIGEILSFPGKLMERYFLIWVFLVWVGVYAGITYDDWEKMSSKQIVSGPVDRVEILFWHAMGGPLGQVMEDLIDRFNRSQKEYYVKSTSMGSYDTLQKKLLASLVAQRAPDIAQNYESLTRKFIKHRKIICFDDLLASESENIRSDIIPVLLSNNTFDGKLWSFPFNKSVPVLYYNKELFRKAGIDPDRPPATLDELASYARRLTIKGPDGKPQVIGFATGKGNVWMFLCRLLQFGGRMTDQDGTRAYFDEEPATKAVEYIQNLVKEGITAEAQGFDHQNDFKAQRAAMIENSIVSKVHMESGIKFDYGIAPLPGAASKAVILSGTNINIFDNHDPRKVKGAWEFIKWFTSTEVGAEWSIRTTYLPVRISSLQSPILKSALEKDRNLKAPYVQLDYSYFEPRLGAWFEIRDLMADFLERSTLEMGPAAKYMKEMNEEINGILAHTTN